ncbi:LOW QUALITY PROTEIN: hypothetical protein MAR_036646, partial [Mya arenaria]
GFIFVGQAGSNTCFNSLQRFLDFAKTIGLPIKSSKTVFPNTQVEVHGILVDTNSLTASLPPDKVQLLRTLLEVLKNVTLKQLQSLLGHLNFACKVIKPGRCFLRRLYDLTTGCAKPNHHIRLTSETKAVIALWHTFLNDYNGCTLLTGDRFTTSTTLKFFTDAAGSKGFACTHGSSWTFGIFPQKVKQHHISILELYPIALAVTMFGHLWQNINICFICDNMAVVYCLNKQSSKDKTMMKLIRNIVLSALENNFCFQAKHISTKKNTICDLLSRLQVQEALALAPHLNKTPLPLPIKMSPLAFYLPATSVTVASFVAHLHLLKYSPSTISSHLSAMTYQHQLTTNHDPCNSFIVHRMVLGAHKTNSKSDCRKPLLHEDIKKLCKATVFVFATNPFLRQLCQAILLISFHGFFRMGELLPSKSSKDHQVVQLKHVEFKKKSVHIRLHQHKTKKTSTPCSIIIPSSKSFCPVTSLKSYLSLRGNSKGPLFILANNSS